MPIRATTKIGVTNITVDAKDIKDLFQQIGIFTELPNKCACGSENIRLRHRVAKGYDFYSLLCGDCGHEFALGQLKEGGNLYPKGPWAPPYKGGDRDDPGAYRGEQAQGPRRQNHGDEEDDIPF
jgi:hypothetical protein